jgi:hypothetical protein
MRRRSRTSRDSGQSPSSIGRRNNCFGWLSGGLHVMLDCTRLAQGGGTGKDGSDLLEAIKISASRRSSCWSLCRDRVCRLERLTSREVFPNHFFYWFSLISPVRPYGYHGRIRALLSKPCHVWGMFPAGVGSIFAPYLMPAALLVPLSNRKDEVKFRL